MVAVPNLLSLFTCAPHLQRRIGELLIAQIDASEAQRTAVGSAITEHRDALLPLLHLHGLVPSLIAALLRALDSVGNSRGGISFDSEHFYILVLCYCNVNCIP